MSDSPPPPELKAPIRMWRDARQLLVNIWSVFGNPEDLAQTGAISRKLHKLYASWLRVAEALMRHLLMIEAAAVPAPPPVPPASCRQKNVAGWKPAVRDFLPGQPHTWRVSFRCSAAADRRLPAGKPSQPAAASQADPKSRLEAGAPLHRRILSTHSLALRYEAVLRAFNDPIPYARRLARRLHAQPQLAQVFARHPPEYVHHIDRAEEIIAGAERAWPASSGDSS